MNWRSFLAIVLSLLVLFLWPVFAKKVLHYPIERKGVTNDTAFQRTVEPPVLEKKAPITITPEPKKKTLGALGRFILKILGFLHNILRNWGLAIIVLSLLSWLIFSPLTARSMQAMKRMQELNPKIEEMRQKYKDNPQKLNKEIMQLYREAKVNPLSGCLPLFFQLPVIMGLYQVVFSTDTLKGTNFLWIKDLSKPDSTFNIQGFSINILPIIMTLLMFLQQKQTLKGSGGEQAERQKMMSIIFPIIFGVMFYKWPSGLVLYWLTNSLLMCISQWKTTRIKA